MQRLTVRFGGITKVDHITAGTKSPLPVIISKQEFSRVLREKKGSLINSTIRP